VLGEPVQVRTGAADLGAASLLVGVQIVWVAQQQTGDVPGGQRSSRRGGRRLSGPPRPDVMLHGVIAAPVAQDTNLGEQGGGVGDAVGPATPQVLGARVENARAAGQAATGKELLDRAGPGEAADRAAGQAQLPADPFQRVTAVKELVDMAVVRA
jgi:hypothetical protein